MTVFKLKVKYMENERRQEGGLDLNAHIDMFAGKDEDNLVYAGTMILRKEELVDLINRIGRGQVEDMVTKDTPEKIRSELHEEVMLLASS